MSCSSRCWAVDPPLIPLSAMSVLLNRSNLNRVLIRFLTWLLASFLWSAIISETRSTNTVHSGPIPPEVVKTRGTKDPFSD